MMHKHNNAKSCVKEMYITIIVLIPVIAFIARYSRPPPKFMSPFDTKAPGPSLIYLVGPLAISDPITIFV